MQLFEKVWKRIYEHRMEILFGVGIACGIVFGTHIKASKNEPGHFDVWDIREAVYSIVKIGGQEQVLVNLISNTGEAHAFVHRPEDTQEIIACFVNPEAREEITT